MEKNIKVIAMGELIWDVYTDAAHIGGAPFNFCGHFTQLGGTAYEITAVGNDDLGVKALEEADKIGMKKDFISIDDKHATGQCIVTLSGNGIPEYNVLTDTAYDNIPMSDETIAAIAAQDVDAFYFGTLIQRNAVSRDSLVKILNNVSFKEIFCDVNMRDNCYDDESLERCLTYATVLKLSRGEAEYLAEKAGSPAEDYKATARLLCAKYANLKILIITVDKDGAIVYDKANDKFYSEGNPDGVVVKSTVGAGDSFGSTFLYYYLSGKSIEDCLHNATIVANFVVSEYGALPHYSKETLGLN